MDEFYSEKVVFIHSEVLDTKCMIDRLQSLSAICPGINITSVVRDKVNTGYRVYFEDLEVQNVLKKRLLKVAGRDVGVYPIITCLLIYNVPSSKDIDVESELTLAVQEKYGKVLHFEAVSAEKSANANSFLVQIDIPEMKDLSVFKRNGMFVRVPKMYKTFPVEFWCTCCKKRGHTYQECLNRPSRSDTSPNTGLVGSLNQNSTPTINASKNNACLNSSVSNFSETIDDIVTLQIKREASTPIPTNESDPCSSSVLNFECENIISPIVESHRRDELIAELVPQCLQPFGSTAMKDNTDSVTPIKSDTINPGVERNGSENAVSHAADSHMSEVSLRNGVKQNAMSSAQQHDPLDLCQVSSTPVQVKSEIVNKVHELNMSAKKTFQNDENSSTYLPVATSTTSGDDDLQIINYESSYDYISTQYAETGNDIEESDNAIKDGSIIPQDTRKSSKFSAVADATHFRRESTSSSQKQCVWDTSILSDQLKKCISDSCAPAGSSYNGALDKQKLDAFFMHVYKKINPRSVARNYTDTDTLKQQLQQIVDSYYTMPTARTKEDSAFIMWLELLIKRYDGKRKRSPNEKPS